MASVTDRPIRKFNPGTFQSDEDVTDQFVVRNHELRTVLDVLRGNLEPPSCQHVLIVAPRGRGKTMFLARVAAELRKNDEFSQHFLPVQFMEENQEVFNLADFWLEALFHLSRQCEAHEPVLAQELRDRHGALGERWREQMLEGHARAAVLDVADRLNRKLVFMVENFQALCKDVDEDFGWKLREVLQTEPQIILLASATSHFRELDDAEQPFFEMFRIINLWPLTTDECRRLWQVVSGDKVSGREMRPLEILTGGSPRLLVIAADFAQHKSLRQLMEELITLIDEHTEYFRGHLEVLGKTERRVYVAVLDLWQRSTPGEISSRARMDVRVVSTMLGRLVDRGAVIAEGSGRKRRYVAAERLYSIYYKLRRERDEAAIVESLVRFMTVFYGEAEQAEMFPGLIIEATESSIIREGLAKARSGIPALDNLFTRMRSPIETELRHVDSEELKTRAVEIESEHTLASRYFAEISAAVEEKAFEKVIGIAEQALATLGTAVSLVPSRVVALVLYMKAEAHEQLGDSNSASSAYGEAVGRFGTSDDPTLQKLVAVMLYGKAEIHRKLGHQALALSAYGEFVDRFGASDDPMVNKLVKLGWIRKAELQTRLGCVEDALQSCDELERGLNILDVDEKNELACEVMCVRIQALLVQKDFQVAMDVFKSLYETFVNGDESMIQGVLQIVLDLVAAGSSTREIIEILSKDDAKAVALTPLLVALRQHVGEPVRAPDEVLEVAKDIRKRIMGKIGDGTWSEGRSQESQSHKETRA
ncbi:MAG: AAA family ATPase [Rhodobacteraceae bacterium]|nr:AAA family ATPase [Paracoccaceae bacterium]MCY4137838.1 AAA family ATPase [Paracoccaceae bacterium]